MAHMLNSLDFSIHGIHFAALAQQINEISPITASGIEHAHARRDIPAKYLIENVDIDLPELFLNTESHFFTVCAT